MNKIDLSQLITAEAKADAAKLTRAAGIKAECAARIIAVVDEHTQASLLAAAVTGALSAEDKATFADGQAWIEATKAASREAIQSGDDPQWPEPSAAVVDLAKRF